MIVHSDLHGFNENVIYMILLLLDGSVIVDNDRCVFSEGIELVVVGGKFGPTLL